MIDSVVGKISAANAPIPNRAAISASELVTSAPTTLAAAKPEQADDQRRTAAVAVAQAARGEHESREGEVVAVDDPLQAAGAGVELGRDARAARR